jgi:3-hydroxymyristoyl/3-hydroxydecanoyl-(acyl carrier protein) dehydratase
MVGDMELEAALSADVAFERIAVEGGAATAQLRASALEALCAGHFPGSPIVPGSHLVALFGELAQKLWARRRMVVAASRCIFKAPVRPGDELRLIARMVSSEEISAEATVGGSSVASARLRFADE